MSDESVKMSLNILMEMTDKYKDTMKEGDYLIMCNSLKELYTEKVDETWEMKYELLKIKRTRESSRYGLLLHQLRVKYKALEKEYVKYNMDIGALKKKLEKAHEYIGAVDEQFVEIYNVPGVKKHFTQQQREFCELKIDQQEKGPAERAWDIWGELGQRRQGVDK